MNQRELHVTREINICIVFNLQITLNTRILCSSYTGGIILITFSFSNRVNEDLDVKWLVLCSATKLRLGI